MIDNVRWLWGFLRPYRRYAASIVILVGLVIGLACLWPLYLLVFVNEVVLQSNLNLLLVSTAAILCAIVAKQYAYGVALFHRERLAELVAGEIRRRLFARFLERPPGYFQDHAPGRLTALALNEVDNLREIVRALLTGTATVASIVLIFSICFWIDARLALLLTLPVLGMISLLFFDRWMRRNNEISLEAQQGMLSFLKVRLSNVLHIQAFRRERTEAERAATLTRDLAEKRARTELPAQLSQRLFRFTEFATLIAIVLVGGVLVIRRETLTLGAVCAVLEFGFLLIEELRDLFGYIVRGRIASVALRRVRAAYEEKPALATWGTVISLPRARGRVEFRSVSFRYAAESEWALRDVSFAVEPGEWVAIVGPSGSGKSTIFRLLFRFHDLKSGSIRLDGYDLRCLDLGFLRSQLGLATQEPILFDASVMENILYGREGAKSPEAMEAARISAAHEFISRLPGGYATRIGEGGSELSGGERHRLALARVVLKDAPILLLDEVTAGLDSRTESEVHESLAGAMQGRTTIMITHQLWAVRRAHRILVLERGRLVQEGAHEDLYRRSDGLYRSLVDGTARGTWGAEPRRRRPARAVSP